MNTGNGNELSERCLSECRLCLQVSDHNNQQQRRLEYEQLQKSVY